MQGIAGTFGAEDKPLVRRMLAKLQHRGPDLQDVFSSDSCTLGARSSVRRLEELAVAIAEEDSVAVASDSYMFNREFLRNTIVPSVDSNASDAQIMLGMYKTIGTRMFTYIDGAYAVAIVAGKKTILARDPYGIKPLYISGDSSRGAYSSEMKSQILAHKKFIPFPPGNVFESGKGFMKSQKTTISWAEEEPLKNHVDYLRNLVSSSVLSCVGSSPSLNVFLSGGIDSSAVAAAAREVVPKIQTVCVGTEESEDIRAARMVARHLGTKHKEKIYSVDDLNDALESVVYYAESFDYPLIRSCVPNFIAARMFTDKSSPTLCGEGGDEIFAGYDYMAKIRRRSKLYEERRHLLETGYLTGFQRVDRMTSSSSLDGMMPFMSHRIVDFGLGLGVDELLGKKPELSKLILRKAFRDVLPSTIVWRRKRKFSDGAGSMHSLLKVAEKMVSDREFEKETRGLPKGRVRTKEELVYYRIFKKHYDSSSAVAAVGTTANP
jgi:asparagine synthase (glutamine-hydrolysing)